MTTPVPRFRKALAYVVRATPPSSIHTLGRGLTAGLAIKLPEHGFDLAQEVGQIGDDRRVDDPLVDLVIGVRRERPHPRDLLPGDSRVGSPDLGGHVPKVLSDRLDQMREPRPVHRIRGPLFPEAGPPFDRLDCVLPGLLEEPTGAACHRAPPYPFRCSE